MKALLRLLLTPAARRALGSTLRPREVSRVLQQTWRIYDQLVPTIPKQTTWGGRLTVRLAACSVGLYRALLRINVPDEEAFRLVSKAAWLVYKKMAVPPRVLAVFVSRDPFRRLKLATDLFRWFPFGPPFYRMEDIADETGVVAFDVLRCPVAEFFRREGHPDLCVRTFCDLDFPLAKAWGGVLQRTGTIASGAERCDFRWRVATSPSAGRPCDASAGRDHEQ